MTTLKSSVRIAGQVISNNDPQMVITLDPHAGVQISSIQDDSITYEFKGGVTQEALYNLNLTFTYQGRYQVKVPCTFKHTVIEIDFTVETHQINTKMWGHSAQLPFIVKHGVEDITDQLLEVSIVDNQWVKPYSSVGGPANEWYMTGIPVNTVDSIVECDYTFKLPTDIDPAGTVRTARGSWRVSPYDGRETKVTVEFDELRIPYNDGNTVPYIFTLDYKGLPNPNTHVDILSSSILYHSTVWRNNLQGTNQRAIQFSGITGVGIGESELRFGKSTDTIDKMAIIRLPTYIYQPGIVLSKVPSKVVGESLSTHVKDIEFQFDGLVIPATDVNMSMNEADLKITEKTADTVTFQLMRDNTTTADIDYAVGVSFSANGKTGSYAQQCTVTPKSADYVVETTPLSLKLWETKPLVFTITNNGVDISGPISNITMTDSPEVSSKYELVKLSGSSWGIKAISSSTTTQLTANAQLNFTFMDGGTEHVMSQTVSLTTEINNGEIPTNRFNVEFL